MKKFPILFILLCLVCAVGLIAGCSDGGGGDDGTVVRAVLFYSPTCPHCHEVKDTVLPPLMKEYGSQLQIGGADTSTPDGQALYQSAVEYFGIQNRGVPTLIIGDAVLVGSAEIPTQLPGLIEKGMSSGGIDWPTIPGLVAPDEFSSE